MIKAVIFDMFETLVTHYETPLYMGKQICVDMGIPEAKFREIWNPTDEDRTLGKKSLEEVIEEILLVNGRYSSELFNLIIERRKQSKVECFNHIHEEIIPTLKTLKEHNFKIGLITNCYFEERDVIRESSLFFYFDALCMSCELGLQKPDTEIFKKCTELLSVDANECIYVGDGGSFELETAKSLGMHPLQATWYFKEIENYPQKANQNFPQAKSPMEILREIEKHNAE